MYAVDFGKGNKTETFAFKLNNNPVKITGNPYWKKDLLETSLHAYAMYMQHGQKVFLDDYLAYKFPGKKMQALLVNRLTPGKIPATEWPGWFAKASGYKVQAGDSIELMQYDFTMEKGKAHLIDSISISKSILP